MTKRGVYLGGGRGEGRGFPSPGAALILCFTITHTINTATVHTKKTPYTKLEGRVRRQNCYFNILEKYGHLLFIGDSVYDTRG